MNILESAIREKITFGKKSSTGFERCICKSCNDYKTRGGFNFTSGITYNCFNCGIHFGIIDGVAGKNSYEVLESFGFEKQELSRLLAQWKLSKTNPVYKTSSNVTKTNVIEISLPKGSRLIQNDTSDPWFDIANIYLNSRSITSKIECYINCEINELIGRIIFPIRDKLNRIIYWQARSLDDSIKPRFINPESGKNAAIWNESALYLLNHKTIYVTEGIFDAASCGSSGIALIGGPTKNILEKLDAITNKTIVGIIDKNKPGKKMAAEFITRGWPIVFMPDNIEDANHCLQKLGKIFLMTWLSSKRVTGLSAQILVRKYCS